MAVPLLALLLNLPQAPLLGLLGGRCVDCGVDIPFDRLKAEPWALRCVDCASARERAAARRA